MKYSKVIIKGLGGLVVGAVSVAVSNPQTIASVAGMQDAGQVAACAAILTALCNWWKHRGE